MKKLLFAIATTLALAFLYVGYAAAQTNTVTITATGTISYGSDSTGVFIPSGGSLNGDTVTVTFVVNQGSGTLAYSASQTGVSSATGSTSITINGISYNDTAANLSVMRAINGWGNPTYSESVGNADNAESLSVTLSGNSVTTTTSTSPDFNWIDAFSDSASSDAAFAPSLSIFSISDGTNSAFGIFTLTSISSTQGTCSAISTAPLTTSKLTIDDSSTGQQPSILGGNAWQNQTTTITASLTGVNGSGLYPITLGSADSALTQSSVNESIAGPGIIADPTSGIGTAVYSTFVTGASINDQVGGNTCGVSTTPVPVFEVTPALGTTGLNLDIGQSQVDDTTFTDTSFSGSNIQVFLTNAHNGTGPSALANFYFVDTSDDDVQSGFWDVNGDGKYDEGDVIYCSDDTDSSPDTACIAEGYTAISSNAAAPVIYAAAYANSLNPQVMLATMQKEYGVTGNPNLPSTAALNLAMGDGVSSTFYEQLKSGASDFSSIHTTDLSHYDSGVYFFPVNQTEKANYPNTQVTQSIQYGYGTDTPAQRCDKSSGSHGHCGIVGMFTVNAATEAQYHYTPFVETSMAGGGYRGFEYWWAVYSGAGWYQ